MASIFIYHLPGLARGDNGVVYTRQDISMAISAAIKNLASARLISDDLHPHRFSEYPFTEVSDAPGPIFEFPILKDHVYDADIPAGPDRVVFGGVAKGFKACSYIGVVTVGDEGKSRILHTDLTRNSKTGVDEPFTDKENEEHNTDPEASSPPEDLVMMEAKEFKVPFDCFSAVKLS